MDLKIIYTNRSLVRHKTAENSQPVEQKERNNIDKSCEKEIRILEKILAVICRSSDKKKAPIILRAECSYKCMQRSFSLLRVCPVSNLEPATSQQVSALLRNCHEKPKKNRASWENHSLIIIILSLSWLLK
jgi:hypothetical protein